MKKLNKFFAVLVALAMMATLCVSMAFASDGDEGTTSDTPKATLTKTLTVPNGTAIPDGAYATFTFTDEKVNGVAAETTDKTIGIQTVHFDTDTSSKTTDTAANTDKYTYTIDDVLNGIEWTRAGVYTWNVQEATYVIDDGDSKTTDYKKGDSTKYTLVVKVTYDTNGKLVVSGVNVKKGADSTEKETNADSIATDGLSFANTYYTTTGNPEVTVDDKDDEDPDNDETTTDENKLGDENNDSAGLSVEKIVDGTYGDKNKQFEITVHVSLPAIEGANEAKAYIRRANAEEGATLKEVKIDANNNFVAKLADGDKLVFTKIAEGTKYTVIETDASKDNTGKDASKYTATGEVEDATAVVKATNSATITNKSNQDDVTPTGILINNLPYIALALVAVGGLVAYVVVRRRDNENA